MASIRIIVPSLLSILLFTGVSFFIFLPALRSTAMDRKREMIRELTETAWQTLSEYERQERVGKLTREEAQARAIAHIRSLRYGGDGKDYFWINDLHPRMIMHPYRPDLDGKDMSDYADPAGKSLFMEFVRTVRERGGGFVDYMWQWMDESSRVVPKVSYVKGFAPWGWVIGTGVYIEDVRSEMAAVTRKLTLASTVILVLIALILSYVIRQGMSVERQRQHAVEEKQKLQEQLHQAQKMEAVGQLAAGVAHDFNNLLTVVLGRVEQVRALMSAGEASEALKEIEESVHRATDVTRSLLTFSRNVPMSKEPMDLCRAIEESGQFLRRILPSSIELVVEAQCEPHVWVLADSTQLQQVVLNLAVNARDAMPAGGRFAIRVLPGAGAEETPRETRPDDLLVRVAFRDTGVGIPRDIQSRIFEPFFSTKPRGQGTGLGLSIVHGIVNDHGGWVEVESTPGRGSTFTIVLPCIPPGAPVEKAARSSPVRRGAGERILLAEDNRNVRMIITSSLQSLGYHVVSTGDGESMLERYRQLRGEIGLLLSDVDLPKRNGADCLREIRASGGRIPAILMTGTARDGLEGQLDGRTALLRKPFEMAELGRLVYDMLKRPSGSEANA